MNNALFPILALTDLDCQISDKLKKAGIVFVPELENTGQINTPNELQKLFFVELLSRHPLTIKEFAYHCLSPLIGIIASGKGSFPREYIVFITMVSGYNEAFISIKYSFSQDFAKPSTHLHVLETIFSKQDVEKIEQSIKELLHEFEHQCESCKIDFLRDRSVENKQEALLVKFTETLLSGVDTEKVESMAKEIDSSMLSSMYFKKKGGDLFGSPYDRLAFTLSKLFLYWDILHHAGYVNFSDGTIDEIHWCKFQ